MKNYLIPPRINYKHVIVLGGKSKRVAYHCIIKNDNIEKIIITRDVSWESVVELASRYKDVVVYDTVGLFKEALKELN